MDENKRAIWISAACMLVLIIIISVGSIKGASNMVNYSGPNGIFSVSVGGKAELRNTIELPLAELKSLTTEYGSKNIYVYPSSEEKVIIKEYLYSDKQEALATVEKKENGEVIVRGSKTANFVLFGFFVGEGERIEIYVPENGIETLVIETGSGNVKSEFNYKSLGGKLSVQAGSGNITWNSTTVMEAAFQTGSGNIKLENITGDIVKAKTGSGNITVDKLTANAALQAGSGNITVEEFSGCGSVETNSGNVKVEVDKITGDILSKTGSGNNKLEILTDLTYTFKAKTGSGNINTEFDNELTFNKKGNEAEGSVGTDPVHNISMQAGSGNVKVSVK